MSENEVKKLQASGFYRKVEVDTGTDEQYGQVKEEIDKGLAKLVSIDDGEKLQYCMKYMPT